MAKNSMAADTYVWEGMNKQGKRSKGEVSGSTLALVKADLRRQGITPLKVKKKPKPLFGKRKKRITAGDIAIFSRQLATMMAAGVPMVQSFEIVGKGHENPSMQDLIMAVKADVESGSSLAESLAKHPLYFDDLYCSLVHAGEQAGILETLLDKIATYKEKVEAIKGKIKKVGRGANARVEFVENEKQISDEDLKALRELSRRLDNNSSPYLCIVSVLMLREGWDVRNVTTIVPLRPYSSKANILPEQTLGRGLRRMTPPGQANELVTVVEHPAFASLYQQELAQEGLPLEIVDLDHVPATTISIYPDEARKDLGALEIEVPALTAGHHTLPKLVGLKIKDVKKGFSKYKPLPLGSKGVTEIEYEGRHLFTGEVIEKMKISLPLLESGVGAVSYYVKQLEHVCKLRGLHNILAPLIQTFLEEILFEKKTSLFDQALISRLADSRSEEHTSELQSH